jgi:ATP/maltotriose-dependent transcriptional regulator MalT
MTMAFFSDETVDHHEMPQFAIISDAQPPTCGTRAVLRIQTIAGKTEVPTCADAMSRPRINDFLSRSVSGFSATLIAGRAGSGKTTCVADFLRGDSGVAWYTLDTADSDCAVFQHYFWIALLGEKPQKSVSMPSVEFLTRVMTAFEKKSRPWPSTVVLDGIHHLFDSDWFGELFGLLIASLPSDTHLITTCRSKPPSPLWRLRSKQVLNVVDEKLLAFSQTEAEELFSRAGAKRDDARRSHRAVFGHAGKLVRALEKFRAASPRQ